MTPRQYEDRVAEHFRRLGYNVEVTPLGNDYGVDVFASREGEKVAIQAKMYGGSNRPVNREMVMQLHGAKDYFDCSKAMIVTNGNVLDSARAVARKLKIDIVRMEADVLAEAAPAHDCQNVHAAAVPGVLPASKARLDFDAIWLRYIVPLKGRTLVASDGRTNTIVTVDWAGVERITSSGKRGRIAIEIFRRAVTHICERGEISREEINDEYSKRASSGVVLVLSQVPLFEQVSNPIRLRMKRT